MVGRPLESHQYGVPGSLAATATSRIAECINSDWPYDGHSLHWVCWQIIGRIASEFSGLSDSVNFYCVPSC
jgi:hypothetical protein